MTNSPDFIFAWLGLWAIGAAPAMINYNLAGNALLHCLKLNGSKIILVDEDPALQARIEESRTSIQETLGMNIYLMDANQMQDIRNLTAERPDDRFREGVKGDWPMAMFYTRFVFYTELGYGVSNLCSSGTTGMPKGVPFNIDRGFGVGSSVNSLFLSLLPFVIVSLLTLLIASRRYWTNC
jgi:acyl-CoA synthetase (AMP-forming)/AMP-acid ligase II